MLNICVYVQKYIIYSMHYNSFYSRTQYWFVSLKSTLKCLTGRWKHFRCNNHLSVINSGNLNCLRWKSIGISQPCTAVHARVCVNWNVAVYWDVILGCCSKRHSPHWSSLLTVFMQNPGCAQNLNTKRFLYLKKHQSCHLSFPYCFILFTRTLFFLCHRYHLTFVLKHILDSKY